MTSSKSSDITSSEPGTLTPYYEGLNRMVTGNTLIVPPGSRINLSNVAIESGKSAGSIKRGRPVYAPLIRAIDVRAKEQEENSTPGAIKAKQASLKAAKARADSTEYKQKYLASLARELMLLRAWDKAQQELRKGKVVPIKSTLSQP